MLLAVLRALALGDSNPQIAARLHITPGTVNSTLGRIYRKLNVRNRSGPPSWPGSWG